MYIDINVPNLSVLNYKTLLLLLYKYKHAFNIIDHNDVTWYKLYSNLNTIKFYKLTTQSPIYKCTLLYRKLNLNLYKFFNIKS